MTTPKWKNPVPYFLLFALFWGAGVLNGLYPSFFFPSLPLKWVWCGAILGGVYCMVEGMGRWNFLIKRREKAGGLVKLVAEGRHAAEAPEENDVILAGRTVSRLVRNADEDLREVKPDFSLESLTRLQRYLPKLLLEVENEQDARIRLGIVGTYLGETLVRNRQWQWFFRTDPALRQFSYLTSVLRWQEKQFDPYAWAAECILGKRKMADCLNEVK